MNFAIHCSMGLLCLYISKMTELNLHVAAQTIHENMHLDMYIPVPEYLFTLEYSKSFYGQKYQDFFDVFMCYKIVIGEKRVC